MRWIYKGAYYILLINLSDFQKIFTSLGTLYIFFSCGLFGFLGLTKNKEIMLISHGLLQYIKNFNQNVFNY